MISCVYVLIYRIKCIHNIEYKMYLQNEKMPKLWVFVDCSNKRRFLQIYKTSLQNETVRQIRKRRIRREVFRKKGVLENFTKFTGKAFVGVSFLIKLQASGLNLCLKRDSNSGVFPWIWWNFSTLFLKKHLLAAFVQKVYFCKFFLKKKVVNKSFFNLLV